MLEIPPCCSVHSARQQAGISGECKVVWSVPQVWKKEMQAIFQRYLVCWMTLYHPLDAYKDRTDA